LHNDVRLFAVLLSRPYKRPQDQDLNVCYRGQSCYYSTPDRGVEYCEERVCLCVRVCQSTIISSDLHVQSLPVSVHVTYGRGSVLLWRRNDMLCTSGFMDNIIFAQKPRLLDVAAQLKCSAHVALGLAVSCVH